MRLDTEDKWRCRGGGGSSGLLMIVEECIVKYLPVDEEGINLWPHFRPHCNSHKWKVLMLKEHSFVCAQIL